MSTDVDRLRQELLQWRAGALLTGLAVVAGVVQAFVWSRIAPGEPFYVSTTGQYGALPTASYHQFAGVAIFALIGLAVGTTAAAAVWRWRSTRGLAAALTVAGANLLGALTAYLLAAVFAPGVDPASVGAVAAQTVVTGKPTVGLLAVVAQPAVAVALYTFLAAWNGRPDLARHPARPAVDAVPSLAPDIPREVEVNL
jgi:hypothetical protein